MSADHLDAFEPDPREDDRSVAELMRDLVDETGTLVRQELDLARAEMAEQGRVAARSAGLLGAGAVAGLLAAGALTAFLIALLDTAMVTWLAAFIVTVAMGVVASVLIGAGRARLQEMGVPTPDQTIDTIKEDAQWAKTRARSATR